MRLLYKIPIVGPMAWRRHLATIRAQNDSFRRDSAMHNAAVARILAEAARIPDPWRDYR